MVSIDCHGFQYVCLLWAGLACVTLPRGVCVCACRCLPFPLREMHVLTCFDPTKWANERLNSWVMLLMGDGDDDDEDEDDDVDAFQLELELWVSHDQHDHFN